jgi:hypothetical protein
LAEVNFPAFKKSQYFAAGAFADLHPNVGIALRISAQKTGQHTFDVLRRAGDLQDSCLSMTEQLSLFFHCAGAIEKDTAVRNQLLAFARQKKPSTDSIEEPQSELTLKLHDLSRQGRLGHPQAQCRLRDGSELGHSQECKGLPQVHVRLYHFGIGKQNFFVLDASQRRAEFKRLLHRAAIRRKHCEAGRWWTKHGLRRNT